MKNLFKRDGTKSGAMLLPIRLTLVYLVFSVIVYAFGPFDWKTANPVLFYALLVLYMVALWFGYRVGIKKTFSKAIQWEPGQFDKWLPLLSILIIVNYLIYVVNIFRDYGMQTLDFPELIRQMSIGIRDPKLGYHYRFLRVESLQGTDVLGGRLFTLFNYFWSFFRYPILLLGMLNFKKLKIWGKLPMVIYLITMFFFYLSIGTTIDVLHIFLLLEIPAILSAFKKWQHRQLNRKYVIKLIASLMAGMMLVMCYFTWMMVSRGGINNYDKPDYNIGGVQLNPGVVPTNPTVPVTPSNPTGTTPNATIAPTPNATIAPTPNATIAPTPNATMAPTPNATTPTEGDSGSTGVQLPPIVMKFWISFSSYFTQGYYGMAQSLELPWTPMFGVGNSMFLVDFISEHVYDIDQFTYQMKAEKAFGWDSDIQWNCMYTWLANDVSFYGVIAVMLLIGLLFGAMFKDAITTENPFAKLSIFYFILMILFIPCNNQIAQRSDTLFSFVMIVFCWLISKYPPKILRKILAKQKRGNSNVA